MGLAEAKAYLAARGLRPELAAARPVVLDAWRAQRQAAQGPGGRGGGGLPGRRRTFAAAGRSDYTYSWTTSDQHLNTSLYRNLRTLRARSRDLARNNDYAKAFLGLVVDNVVGPTGIALQVQARNGDGTLAERDSRLCELAFAHWGRRGNCEVTAALTWIEVLRIVIRKMAMDGEIFVQRLRGRGPHGYQIKLIDASLCDETHIGDLPNGNRIRMGIELDRDDRPLAYHFLQGQVTDAHRLGTFGRNTVRVPADEIWHLFLREDVGQLRGVPWMHTTMTRQKRLGSYEDAAVAAAEEGAKKLAWIQVKGGDPRALANQVEDTEGSGAPTAGTLYTESGEGVEYGLLPEDAEIANWDPKYPDADFAAFCKQILRGIASGLRVSYHKLASDLEGVNFSSSRTGELTDRDVWKGLQQMLIDALCDPAYAEWLPYAILARQLPLPLERVQKFDAAVWQGRRWPWVDPEKDIRAHAQALELRVTSRARIIRDMGYDPDEIWAELEAEDKRFGPPPAQPGVPASAAAPQGDPDA